MASVSSNQDGYVLGRNRSATSRLNYQHYLWQQALGFHLHPSITPLPENARIADVATGSGVWLLDLSTQLPPTTTLDGLDINLEQCPPQAWLPQNVSFRNWDFFSDVPSDLMAAYDMVHVRLVAVIIKRNDPIVLIKNLALLLKPGGFIQWEEPDAQNIQIMSVSPGLSTSVLEQLMNVILPNAKSHNNKIPFGFRDWIHEIPNLLVAHGFCDSQRYEYCEPPHMASFWNDLYIIGIEEAVDATFKENDSEQAKGLREMLLGASRESSLGAAIKLPKSVVVARKEML